MNTFEKIMIAIMLGAVIGITLTSYLISTNHCSGAQFAELCIQDKPTYIK